MPSSRAPAANRAPAHLLERGHIYFAYRPKIDAEEVRGLDDVEQYQVQHELRKRLIRRLRLESIAIPTLSALRPSTPS